MRIDRITVYQVSNPFVQPFETSFTRFETRDAIVLRIDSEGVSGWGECKAFFAPLYNPEDNATCRHVIEDLIIPMLVGTEIDGPEEFEERFSHIRENRLAKATVENALWELRAAQSGRTLKELLGGTSSEVLAGVSVGLEQDRRALLSKIESFLATGYHRIKVKIRPGEDVDLIRDIRRAFGPITLTVDANSAYTLRDADVFRRLDEFDLEYIEQPLGCSDLAGHAELQRRIATPLCLDESIVSCETALAAIRLGACRVVNIKSSRCGGLLEGRRVHDLCRSNGIRVWCGGMCELGIGRVQNIAFASLPGFAGMAHDLTAASRFFRRDVTRPMVDVTDRCTVVVPGPDNALRYEVDEAAVRGMAREIRVFG